MEEKIYVCNIREGCYYNTGKEHCSLYWGVRRDHIRFKHDATRLITGEDSWCGAQVYVKEIDDGYSG